MKLLLPLKRSAREAVYMSVKCLSALSVVQPSHPQARFGLSIEESGVVGCLFVCVFNIRPIYTARELKRCDEHYNP